ncbi:site-specific integrase [Chitinibacter sp. SCUT-21]|uniref:site-specific integrase n=1 Tax=Chitinibacter sp. SCUT-21 TaxID=2970891 RepID=UPI0035A620D7
MTSSTTADQIYSAVLSKVDPTLVEVEQARYLITSILGLSSSDDGLAQAIKCLNKVFDSQAWIRGYIPSDQQYDPLLTLQGLGRQLERDRSRFIIETLSARNKNNPLHGKISQHMVFACWTETVLLPVSAQRDCMYFLLGCLFVWQCRNPRVDAAHHLTVPTELEKLCGKIRQLLSARDDTLIWPTLNDSPLESLKTLIQAFSQSKNRTLNSVVNGLQILLGSLSNTRLPRIQSTQPNSITPVNPPPSNGPRPPRPRIQTQTGNLDGENGSINLPLRPPTVDITYLPPGLKGGDEEPEIEAFIELAVDNDANSNYVSRDGRFARLRSARYRSAFDNQFLPWAWGHLNEYEIKVIVGALHNLGDDAKVPAVLCVLSIACGVNFQELGDIRIVNSFNPKSERLQVCIADGAWARPFPALPGRFNPNKEQIPLLAPFDDLQVLPLPKLAIQLLAELCKGNNGVLAQILGLKSIDEIEQVMRAYLSEIRTSDRRVRVRPARLRPILFDQLMIAGGDELNSSVVINQDEQSPTAALYYYSSPKKTLVGQYQKTLEQIGLPTKEIDVPESRFGSRLYWEPARHALHIQQWRTEFHSLNLEQNAEFAALSAIHNQFAAYSLWILQCATGHRQAMRFSFNRATLNAGWAILSDKVVDEAHQARLVRLSKIAQQQLQLYQMHLQGLAQRINKFDPQLASKIGTCAQLAQPNIELPLFFTLPTSLGEPIEPLGSNAIWQLLNLPNDLPRNLSRHWFVSGLRETGLPSEWASSAAGHVQIGQQAWSDTMLSAPTSIEAQWDDCADLWLKKLGLEPMQGLKPFNKTKVPSCSLVNQTYLPAKATTESQLKRAVIKQLLREWISEVLAGKDRQELFIDMHLQEAVRTKIRLQYAHQQEKQTEATNYFVRYLKLAGRNLKGLQAIGFVLDCTAESSPFQPDTLVWVARGEWLRGILLSKIPTDFVQLPEVSQYAWIMLSLATYSGLVDQQQQELLYSNFSDAVTRYQQHIWLEWKDGARLVRYWPDFYSTIFISQLAPTEEPPTWAALQKEMNRLLRKTLEFDEQCPEIDFRKKTNRPVDYAIKALTSWLQLHIPGFLSAYATGTHKPWAIERSNLVRLMTGQRVMGEQNYEQVTEIDPIHVQAGGKGSLATSKNALTDLKDILKRAQKASTKNQDDGKVPESRAKIARQIDELSKGWSPTEIASLMFVIAEYTKFQLHRRSNSKPITIATAIDYVHSAAEPLLELVWDQNWVELDLEALESIYIEALDHSTPELRARRAKRLRYFHDFCVQAIGHDELDLHSLDPAYLGIAQVTQTQIILQSEYEKALNLLWNDPHENQEQQQLQALMLMIVFRFGLRVGEVLRLMTCDAVQVGDNIVLYVHTNQLGSPKSSSGVRQVPCWNMTEQEQHLLFSRISSLQHRFTGQSIPLFCQSDNPNILVNRAQITKRLLEILKLVTGNDTVRIHDARHTFASTAIATAVGIPLTKVPSVNEWFGSDAKILRKNWLGIEHSTRRILFAISMHLGHSRVDTTVVSYMHSTDLIFDEVMRQLPLPEIKMAKVAKWCGVTAGLARQLKLRTDSNESKWQDEMLARAFVASQWGTYQPMILPPLTETEILKETQPIELPSLSRLEAVIVNLQQGFSITEIAQHFCMDAQLVERIQRLASGIAENIQFDLIKHFSAAIFRARCGYPAIFLRLLKQFEGLYLDDHVVVDGIAVWSEHYNYKIAGLLIQSDSDREKLINFVSLLDPKWICAAINARHGNYACFNQVDAIIERSYRFKSTTWGKRGKIVTPQIFMQFEGENINKSSRSLSMVQFHRLMFLSAIKIALFNEL